MGRHEAMLCISVAFQGEVIYPGFAESQEGEVLILKQEHFFKNTGDLQSSLMGY